MLIPRYIFQTAPDKSNLAAPVIANIETLKRRNPDWKYVLFDDADIISFIKQHFDAHVFNAYMRINPIYGAAKADLFRYLLVYALGGVYLDIKSSITTQLDRIIHEEDEYILAHWENQPGEPYEGFGRFPEIPSRHGEFQTWHVIARPGHPFLERVIQNVLKNITEYSPAIYGVGKMGVLRTTGPIAYTLAIHPLLNDVPYRQISSARNGLLYSIFGNGPGARYAHRALFKTHYTKSNEAIVLQ